MPLEYPVSKTQRVVFVRKAGTTLMYTLTHGDAWRSRRRARFWNRLLTTAECEAIVASIRGANNMPPDKPPAPPSRPMPVWERIPDFEHSVYEQLDAPAEPPAQPPRAVPLWLRGVREHLDAEARRRETIRGRCVYERRTRQNAATTVPSRVAWWRRLGAAVRRWCL